MRAYFLLVDPEYVIRKKSFFRLKFIPCLIDGIENKNVCTLPL